jgi:predicted nucleic acid-binding protein
VASDEVFADTSALYALLVANDDRHQAARDALGLVEAEGLGLVSSSFVLQETAALLAARIGLEAVRRFHRGVVPVLDVEWVGRGLFERGMAAHLAAGSPRVSLTDWTSVEIMRDRGIGLAFAFDRHFEAQGFELIR